MRRMALSVSAALLLGASSLAMAGQPSGVSNQTQTTVPRSSERSPTTSGDMTTPNYDGKRGQPLSGTSTAPENQSQVKQRLEQQGYSNVQGIHKSRDGWTAKAQKNGQQVTVNLDAKGQVTTTTR